MNNERLEEMYQHICWEGVKWIQREIYSYRKEIEELENFEYDERQAGILSIHKKIRNIIDKEIEWREEFINEYIEQLAEVGISPEDKI